MGSCVSSVEKDSKQQQQQQRRIYDDDHHHHDNTYTTIEFIPTTTTTTQHHLLLTTYSSSRPRSKEEAFFDSQPWLHHSDSDDDDFLSIINGSDFTPSPQTTPLHHKFTLGNPVVYIEETLSDSLPNPSPDNKKRLSELFKESLRRDQPIESNQSVVLEEAKPDVDSEGNIENKTGRSAQCCIPRLVSSRSYSERKKKMMSPAPSVG